MKTGVTRSPRRWSLNVLKALLILSGVFIFVINANANGSAEAVAPAKAVTITCAKSSAESDENDVVKVEKAQITIATDGASEIGLVQGADMRYIPTATCKPSTGKKFDFSCEVTTAANQIAAVTAFSSVSAEGEKQIAIASLSRDGAVRTMTFSTNEECAIK